MPDVNILQPLLGWGSWHRDAGHTGAPAVKYACSCRQVRLSVVTLLLLLLPLLLLLLPPLLLLMAGLMVSAFSLRA